VSLPSLKLAATTLPTRVRRAVSELWEGRLWDLCKGLAVQIWFGANADWTYRGAAKHTLAATKDFADEMYRSFGIRYLFMIAVETPSATIQTGVLDFNECIAGGTSYDTTNPKWKTEGIDLDSWNQHNSDFYNAATPQSKVHSRRLPRTHLQLKTNKYGEPELPDPVMIPPRHESRAWRQDVVRAFMSKHYGM
jgi:hypothetical protein